MLVGLNLLVLLSAGSAAPQPETKTLAFVGQTLCGVAKGARAIDCVNRRGMNTLPLPKRVEGRIVDLAASSRRVCARTDAATMACRDFGRPLPSTWPLLHEVVEDVADVAVGEVHRCVVRTSGAIDCWGNNDQGQLGDGTRRYRGSPTRIELPPAVAVEVAGPSTCALLADGTVQCWGGNPNRESSQGLSPKKVPGLEHVVRLLPDRVALREDGSVVTWDSANLTSTVATSAIDATARCHVDTGGDVSCNGKRMGLSGIGELIGAGPLHCARNLAGQAWCWTLSDRPPVSLPSSSKSAPPGKIDGVEDAVRVSVGRLQACAIDPRGRVFCWADVVDEVPLKRPATDVVVQEQWACALTEDGQWCWHPGQTPRRVSEDGGGRLLRGDYGTICTARDTDVRCRESRFGRATTRTTPSPTVAMLGNAACYQERNRLRCEQQGMEHPQTMDVDLAQARKIVSDPRNVCTLQRDRTIDCSGPLSRACETSDVGVRRCRPIDPIADARDVIDFDFRYGSGCTVHSDGRTRCWPSLDRGPADDIATTNLRAVSVALGTACGIDTSGHVWCWGSVTGPVGSRHRPSELASTPAHVDWLDHPRAP